mgnify:CR=1 FL=1
MMQEMKWDIDYVLELGITQFHQIVDYLNWKTELEQDAMKNKGGNISGPTFG